MGFAITAIRLERDAQQRKRTNWDMKFITVQTNGRTRKREEMQLIGMVMALSAHNSDIAELLMREQNIDPEKIQAVLGLIGCTAEDLEQEDQGAEEELVEKRALGTFGRGQMIKAGDQYGVGVESPSGDADADMNQLMKAMTSLREDGDIDELLTLASEGDDEG